MAAAGWWREALKTIRLGPVVVGKSSMALRINVVSIVLVRHIGDALYSQDADSSDVLQVALCAVRQHARVSSPARVVVNHSDEDDNKDLGCGF